MSFILSVLSIMCVCLFLGGCSKNNAIPDQSLGGAFHCTALIHYNNMEITAKITRVSPGICSVEVLDPPPLSGLGMSWDGQELTMQYMGLSMKVPPSALPDTSFGAAIIDTFNAALDEEGITLKKDGDAILIEGQGEAGDFSIAVDQSGSLISMEIPSIGLSATFTDFEPVS